MTCVTLRLCLLALSIISQVHSIPEDYETVRTSNAAILNRLGLVPLVLPSDGHHRKRLAGPEAFAARDAAGGTRLHPSTYGRRHSSSPHDSHVYIVKLPASPPYYSFSKPHKVNDQNVTVAKPNPGFRSNGKPAKIFHWNLPLVKKINEKKKHMALAKIEQAKKKLEAEKERMKVAEKMSYFKKLAQEQLVAESMKKPSRNNDKWLSDLETIEPRIKSTGNATQLKILSLGNEKTYRSSDDQKHHRDHEKAMDKKKKNKETELEEEEADEDNKRESSRSHHHHHHFDDWRESSSTSNNDVNQQQDNNNNANFDAEVEKKHNNNNNNNPNSRNSLVDVQRAKKHRKKSAGVSYYYAPALTGKSASTSISKHFPGNGKPKAFYVMEKSRKPVYYHPLLP